MTDPTRLGGTATTEDVFTTEDVPAMSRLREDGPVIARKTWVERTEIVLDGEASVVARHVAR